MRALKLVGFLIGGLVAVGSIAFAIGAWVWRDIPAATLEAKYMTPASRFLNVDGVRIHYRDEGSGPPLVLIHANFASLLSWDDWIAPLAAHHRVLRFDMPGHGLTGPDPSGNYALERTVQITEKFVDALGLTRFSIGGTSLGGTVSLEYAAAHPDRVDHLILLSPGALEGRAMRQRGRSVPGFANILKYITPRALAEYMLKSRFGDPSKVTDKLIDQWYEMWMREGQREAILARLRSYPTVDIEALAARVTAPTLILWGEANPQAPVAQAQELKAMFKNAVSARVITYPGVGHMAAEEAGARIAPDVIAFLDSPVATANAGPES